MSTAPLSHLWRASSEILAQIWRFFGSPRQIENTKVFDQRDHALLTRFLRGAEAMLRAVLLIRAINLCCAGDVVMPAPCAARVRQPRKSQPKNSASFRLLDLPPRKRPRSGYKAPPPLYPPTRHFLARPLALRARALLHALKNPETYAHRLARKLKAEPALSLRLNTTYASHYLVIPTELWMAACDAVSAARVRFANTS